MLPTVLLLALSACVTPPGEPVEEAPAGHPVEESEPADEGGSVAEAEPAEPAEADTPEPEPVEPEPAAPEPEPTEPEPEPEEPFVVTEEVYNQTFSEVEQTIAELNQIIRDRDYEAWLDFLTEEYVEVRSDEEELERVSQQPVLQRNSIVVDSLEDYFRFVVVPSRSNARLDDLVFIDDNTVQAVMEIQDEDVILYQLERRDGRWKIATF